MRFSLSVVKKSGWVGLVKRYVRWLLQCHIPVNAITKPVFAVLYLLHVICREGVAWLLRFAWYEPLFRSQCMSVGQKFQMEQLPYIVGNGAILIGNGVQLSGKPNFVFNSKYLKRPLIEIGEGTFIGHNVSLRAAKAIRLGSHCLIAGGVIIADYDGHPVDSLKRRAGENSDERDIKPVNIGDDVWIGADAVILKGVTIGSRSIVGAKAVVTKDVLPDTIVAGNPAVVVKTLVQANECSERI